MRFVSPASTLPICVVINSAARLRNAHVEVAEQITPCAHIAGAYGIALPPDVIAQRLGEGGPSRRGMQHAQFGSTACLKRFLGCLDRGFDDEPSPARADLDDAARFQAEERFADRGTGYLEQCGEGLFAQSPAGADGSGEIGVDDDPVDRWSFLVQTRCLTGLHTSLIGKVRASTPGVRIRLVRPRAPVSRCARFPRRCSARAHRTIEYGPIVPGHPCRSLRTTICRPVCSYS